MPGPRFPRLGESRVEKERSDFKDGREAGEGLLPPSLVWSWVGSLLRARTGKTGLPGPHGERLETSHVSRVLSCGALP